ncbi:MAG: hypothetical protein ACYC4Q_04275, partial [Victivallaceae bacterium]
GFLEETEHMKISKKYILTVFVSAGITFSLLSIFLDNYNIRDKYNLWRFEKNVKDGYYNTNKEDSVGIYSLMNCKNVTLGNYICQSERLSGIYIAAVRKDPQVIPFLERIIKSGKYKNDDLYFYCLEAKGIIEGKIKLPQKSNSSIKENIVFFNEIFSLLKKLVLNYNIDAGLAISLIGDDYIERREDILLKASRLNLHYQAK